MKAIKEVHALVWTAVGTGLCLITLSGSTRTLGLWITGIGVFLHFLGLSLPKEKE
jgi:hypothetical protein